tara:strand:- start:1088 stop:1231 length:144 start_codon:yes stop_codon:yes gene_type:complete
MQNEQMPFKKKLELLHKTALVGVKFANRMPNSRIINIGGEKNDSSLT